MAASSCTSYEEFFVPKYVSSEECIPAIPTNVKPSYYYNGEETEIGYKTVVMTNSDNLGMTFIYMVTDEEQKTCGVRSYKNSHEGTVTIPSNVERSVLNLETGDMITTDFTVTRIMGGGKHGNYWGALRCAQMDTLELPKTIDTYDIFCCCETYNIITVISHRPCATYMHGSAFSSSMEKWVDDDTYNSLYLRSTLHVPFGSYDSYFWTTSWYRFSRIIEGIGDMTLEEPVATLEEGTYDVPQTVQLTNPNGRGDIYYYYVNDNHPLIWNDEYGGSVGDVQKYNNEEIPIDMTTTLVAIVMDGDEISNVIRKEYTIMDEALSVCGVKINNANANDVLGDGTVSYSKDTERVLTLNNATLDPAAMKESTGLEVWGGSLVVKLVGNNKILGTEYGISMGLDNGKGGEYFGGNTLVITSDDDDATLEIDGGYVGLLSYCSNVHIENCTVKILNSSTGIYTKAGGKGDGELSIVDATLEIQAETTACEGLLGLNLSGVSILSPENAEFVPSEMGDVIKKGDKEEDYDMEPTGNFYADGVLLTNIVIGPSGSTGDDVATCIKDVNADEKQSPIYTLQGVRIEKPQKNGMYIKNGKKFVIK